MKNTLVLLALTTSILSVNTHASQAIMATEVLGSIGMSTIGGLTSSGKECGTVVVCREAVQIINDSQNYQQTGKLSMFLDEKIKDTQASNESLSEAEALDSLISDALVILK